MPDPGSPRYDEDEINLFEVLDTLRQGKRAILATSALPLLAGLGLLLIAPPVFEVEAAYSIRVAPMSAYNHMCEHEDCTEIMISSRVLSPLLADSDFVNTGSSLMLTTEELEQEIEYQKELAEINELLSAFILNEAQIEKKMIEKEFGTSALDTEVVANNLLLANRIIYFLEEQGMPLSFEPISVTETKKSFFLFAFAPAFLGALAGCISVLFRKASEDFRTRTAQSEH